MGGAGPFAMIIRNWKKSMFIIPAFSTALYYTYDHTVTTGLMKASCKQVSRLGDERLRSPTADVRHITVILNPVAGKRKAKKLYSKWVEPLLHLAGIKVSVVETDSPNQAFELMKMMSNCDGVAIVGGDGTVHEAINGLMSRTDRAYAAQNFPIAIIPVGQFNSIARLIYGDLRYRNYKEFLILTTMGLIESRTDKFDILKIEDRIEPIYALRDLRYGKYQDNYYKTSGYMIYQDYIKPYWLRFRRFFGAHCKPQIQAISYTKPCRGCTRCYEKHKFRDTQSMEKSHDNSSNTNKRWWTGLIGLSKPRAATTMSSDELDEIAWSKQDNPDCDKWFPIDETSSISEIRACMINEKKICLSISRNGEYEPSEVMEVQDVNLKVDAELENLSGEKTTEDNQKDDPKNLKKFLIDRQPLPPRSVEITTFSKALKIFTGQKLYDEVNLTKEANKK